jgi:hypothetical protein
VGWYALFRARKPKDRNRLWAIHSSPVVVRPDPGERLSVSLRLPALSRQPWRALADLDRFGFPALKELARLHAMDAQPLLSLGGVFVLIGHNAHTISVLYRASGRA